MEEMIYMTSSPKIQQSTHNRKITHIGRWLRAGQLSQVPVDSQAGRGVPVRERDRK
jgi:hypothetical protein